MDSYTYKLLRMGSQGIEKELEVQNREHGKGPGHRKPASSAEE